MQLQAVMLSMLMGIFLLSSAPAYTQFSEAVSAIRSAVRDANRALNPNRKRRRERADLRSTLSDEKPPQPPSKNPKQKAAAQAKTSGSRSEQPKLKSKVEKADPPAGPKASPEPAEGPDPNVWSDREIAKAQRQCRAILRKVKAKLAPTDPIKKGPCGDAAPYRLTSLGTKHRVVFKPAAVLNCPMIRALDVWLRKGLQPLAKRHLGGPITQVSVMSSYSCRNAYGRKKTRLSEHGKANALDIGGFRTRQGVTAFLLADWGPTKRDLIAKAKREQEQRVAREKKVPSTSSRPPEQSKTAALNSNTASTDAVHRRASARNSPTIWNGGRQITRSIAIPTALIEQELLPPLPDRRPSLRQRLDWAKAEHARETAQRAKAQRGDYKDELNNVLYPRQDLGGPKADASEDRGKRSGKNQRGGINKEAFLKGAHHTACKIFGTVLGPEANEAHRDHFHVDLAERRYRNYCR